MTLTELSQLYYLNREIDRDIKRLKELKARSYSPSAPNLSGMPIGGGYDNRIERMGADIVDLEAIIAAKLTQCTHERNRLERYIASIPDSLTRQVFALRFINGLSWVQVSASIGNNTPDGVRMACKRYLEKNK